ncbi:MAG TPA: hypothetical protein DD434_06775 [Bacteroidales bacterium]|nr:hypothetical protein [Bacteroidales bacterium]
MKAYTYIKYILFVVIFATTISGFSQQKTVKFKYLNTKATDAVIQTDWSVNPTPYNGVNFGSMSELATTSTFYKKGTINSQFLLRFDQLSLIPNNAKIISASLKLFGVPNSTNFPLGNSTLSSFSYYIERITSSWDENTVTYSTQPSTASTGYISMPAATSQWNYNYTLNSTSTSNPELINMLNYMKGNNANNWGFMITPNQISQNYSGIVFASSNHSDPTLWPELTITYEEFNCDFKVSADTPNPKRYSFTSLNTYGNHTWNIYDANYIPIIPTVSASSYAYTFTAAGTYYVEHIVTTPNNNICSSIISICVSQQAKGLTFERKNTFSNLDSENTIKVYPNPAKDNVTIKSINTIDKVEIYSIVGLKVLVYNIVNKEANINISSLSKGTYLFKIFTSEGVEIKKLIVE